MSCASNSTVEISSYLKSVDRICHYPIVSDSLCLASHYYKWAKSKNAILDATCKGLEGGLKGVKDKTDQIIRNRFSSVDEILCQQLDKFEKICPVVLESSKTVLNLPVNIYHNSIEPPLQRLVKPVTHCLVAASNISITTVIVVSSKITNSIPMNHLAVSTANTVLNKADMLIDKYLPNQDGYVDDGCLSSTDQAVCGKLQRISKKTQRRVFRKVVFDIEIIRKICINRIALLKSIILELKNRTISGETTKNYRYTKLIKDGLKYSRYLQHLITATANATPRFLCTNTVTALDLINEQLFFVRHTMKKYSGSNIISSKRVHQAADVLDLVRSGIESFSEQLKEYGGLNELEGANDVGCVVEAEDDYPESSVDDNVITDEEEQIF